MVGPKAFIYLENLFHNYNLIKQQLNGIPIMAVVKANGYGHGAVPVSYTHLTLPTTPYV